MFTRTELEVVSQVLRRAYRRELDSEKRRVIVGSLTKLQRLRKALRKRKESR